MDAKLRQRLIKAIRKQPWPKGSPHMMVYGYPETPTVADFGSMEKTAAVETYLISRQPVYWGDGHGSEMFLGYDYYFGGELIASDTAVEEQRKAEALRAAKLTGNQHA